MNNNEDYRPIILPIIRKVMPVLVAHEIAGAYPMLPATNIKLLETSQVSGATWYTVSLSRAASVWVREEYPSYESKWWKHLEMGCERFPSLEQFNVYDVHEKFYTIMQLRWSS